MLMITLIPGSQTIRVPLPMSLVCAALLLLAQTPVFAQTPAAGVQPAADKEYEVGAVLWTQSSAEYRALAYQSFMLARMRLDQDLNQHKGRGQRSPKVRPAVIVDIDETVLDNSRYDAELILRSVSTNSQRWREWCERAEASAVPGAVDFLRYAARRGLRIFYITNRRQSGKPGTIANLRKLNFPDVSEETVMVRADDAVSSKESRRQQVAKQYRIVLLVGDNLNDFTDDFADRTVEDRAAQVEHHRVEFGSRFIVIPNPMYGDWESAIYKNKSDLTEAQKRAYRRSALKGY
jgi:5'-nucleotidase (lipoprotein e(P4) family)